MNTMSVVALWLFVINLGVAFGAGVYEHRIVVSRWTGTAHGSGAGWNAEAARQDDTGRRFWAFVTTVPLTLLTLLNVFIAWNAAGPVRGWWMAAGVAALADRALTFAYFIPTMIALMGAADSADAASIAMRWSNLNYLRHAIVCAAWLTALRAFALAHQH